MEESPPSYTEAIKSPHMSATTPHRHHSHHHNRRSSPSQQHRSSPRHHAHHHPSPPTTRANILDLETDDITMSNTESKTSWESATMALPQRHPGGFFYDPSPNSSSSPRWVGWSDVNTHQSKRSALKTSLSSRHRSLQQEDDFSLPHRSAHHSGGGSSRKVSWDTAPLPMRSKSFGGADSKRSVSSSHHRQGSGSGATASKLPPYRNWNPPLLGTLPDDFLRLKPKVPERVPLMTQKSDPGTRGRPKSDGFGAHSFHR